MALLKETLTQYGVKADYWRVTLKSESYTGDAPQVMVAVALYVSEQARRAESQPVQAATTVIINGEDYKQDMTLADIYEHLKTLPEFEGAVDV